MDGAPHHVNAAALKAALHCRKLREGAAGRDLRVCVAVRDAAQRAQDVARAALEDTRSAQADGESRFYRAFSAAGQLTPQSLERRRNALARLADAVANAERQLEASTTALDRAEASVGNARERFRGLQRATRKLSEAEAVFSQARRKHADTIEELAVEEANEGRAGSGVSPSKAWHA